MRCAISSIVLNTKYSVPSTQYPAVIPPAPRSALRVPRSSRLPLSLSPSLLRSVFPIFLSLVCLSLSGCAGYQIGQRSLYRPDIRTVYVPIVQSNSFRRYLGERLTEAIVKEIELKTPYKVVDSDAADSVLTVKLVSESKRVLTENFYDEPRDIETDFFVQLSWVDRRGDLIMNATDLPSEPLLLNISQTASFVPEAGQSITTAQQEAIQRLAEQVVGQMELVW